MRTLTSLLAAALIFSALPAAALEIGAPLPKIAGETIDSAHPDKATAYDSATVKHPAAYIVVGTRCPSTQMYAERLGEIAKEYSSKGAEVVYLYPAREDDRAAAIAFHTQKKLGGKLLHDAGGSISRSLGAARSTEVFVADPQGKLAYHGAIDDSRDDRTKIHNHYLKTALDELLAGKPVTTTSSQVMA